MTAFRPPLVSREASLRETGRSPVPAADAGRIARRFLRRPARFVRREVLPRVLPPHAGVLPASVGAVRVVGLLSSASGVGKSARLCIEALAASGHAVATDDVAALFASDDGLAYAPTAEGLRGTPAVSIHHLNPPMLLPGLLQSGLRSYYGSYNIGYWAWELETLPREWVEAIRFVDAIMVPSTFCRDAVRRYTRKPVLVVPHPVGEPAGVAAARPAPGGPFRVLGIFNFGSSFARKNPIGLVRAFRAAFGDDAGARLMLKTSQGHRYLEDRAALLAEVGDAPNVEVVDEVWDEARLLALMGAADVYASLHRSEGFGLTLAEAIVTGTPLVATNWSGNADFCPPDLSFPVAYDLVPFADPHSDYAGVRDARWAEPSVEDAARQLRRVRDDPEGARKRAARLKVEFRAYLARSSYDAALASLGSAA